MAADRGEVVLQNSEDEDEKEEKGDVAQAPLEYDDVDDDSSEEGCVASLWLRVMTLVFLRR